MKNFFSLRKLLLVTFLSTICFVSCNSCGENDPDSKENTKLQQKTKSNNSEKPKSVHENKNEKQPSNRQTQQTTNKHTQQPSNKSDLIPTTKSQPKSNYTCSADQENVFTSIKTFEELYELHKEEVTNQMKSINDNDRIFGISDSEGKYFIFYAWLRLSGLIKKFDVSSPSWKYFDLNNFTFSDTPVGKYSNNENDKDFFLSSDEIYIRFPKFEIDPNFASCCIHLGDILDRGRNATICLLTVLYIKQMLVQNGKGEQFILVIGNHELQCYSSDNENKYDILYGNNKQSVFKIVHWAIQNKLMQFFGVLEINNKKVLLTHREISKATVPNVKNLFGADLDLDTQENFFLNINEMNQRFEQKPFATMFSSACDVDGWQYVKKEDSEKIFINQFCGHIHHALTGEGYLDFRSGYFFFDDKSNNAIVYLDNYSTTSISGHSGLSTANIHIFDKTKDLKDGDIVFRFVDSSKNNFQIYKNFK